MTNDDRPSTYALAAAISDLKTEVALLKQSVQRLNTVVTWVSVGIGGAILAAVMQFILRGGLNA